MKIHLEQIKANDKFHGINSGFVDLGFVKTCDELVTEHHFKCPLCNNLQQFAGEMQRLGIYLPQRDALAWNEQKNNASFDVSSCI